MFIEPCFPASEREREPFFHHRKFSTPQRGLRRVVIRRNLFSPSLGSRILEYIWLLTRAFLHLRSITAKRFYRSERGNYSLGLSLRPSPFHSPFVTTHTLFDENAAAASPRLLRFWRRHLHPVQPVFRRSHNFLHRFLASICFFRRNNFLFAQSRIGDRKRRDNT